MRFHMASLRKALGDGKDGARYITTLPGRGYCFVAPVSRSSDPRDDAPVAAVSFPHANLPSRLGRMVGRDDDVLKLSAQLTASRFVTIVGAGGVGKTTVAVAVGHHLIEAFTGAVLFVDLGMLSDPELVAHGDRLHAWAVGPIGRCDAQSDRLSAQQANSPDPRYLRASRRSGGGFGGAHLHAAPQVHILATSREALRVEGEHVYRLDPLACPPDDPGLTAAAVQTFPATQLFVERAVASGARLDVSDAEAPIVASICRKLDGVALAIELAARRVESYGLQQTAALLDQRLTLLWLGPRTAPPRQKTLQATLDWSYGLLSELERVVLRRLAVFVGHFTLDAALAVVTSATLDQVDRLRRHRQPGRQVDGGDASHRGDDALPAAGHDARLRARNQHRRRRARRFGGAPCGLLPAMAGAEREAEWSTLSTGAERAPHFAGLNNVRAALEWCFGARGRCRNRRRTCGRRRAGFSGDVVAAGMSSLVGAGDSGSR